MWDVPTKVEPAFQEAEVGSLGSPEHLGLLSIMAKALLQLNRIFFLLQMDSLPSPNPSHSFPLKWSTLTTPDIVTQLWAQGFRSTRFPCKFHEHW